MERDAADKNEQLLDGDAPTFLARLETERIALRQRFEEVGRVGPLENGRPRPQ